MIQLVIGRSRHTHSRALARSVTLAGACVVVTLALLAASRASAQQAPPPQAGAAPAGPPDLKLLSPLPPPSAEALKQNPPSPDPRNLEGVWLAEGRSFANAGRGGGPSLPYTDKAKQRISLLAERQRAADAQGKVLLTDAGRCRPMGGIGIGADLFPAEILQTPDKVVILSEEGRGRWVIHLQGEHPKDIQPSYFGHAVGHWEGDTLVVETIGLRESDGGFSSGMRSDKALIVSRLRKTDNGSKLEMVSTTYDPELFTQPVEGAKAVSGWHPELTLLEFQCEENREGAREAMVE